LSNADSRAGPRRRRADNAISAGARVQRPVRIALQRRFATSIQKKSATISLPAHQRTAEVDSQLLAEDAASSRVSPRCLMAF